MTFDMRPKDRGYDDLFSAMIASVPAGNFYDFSRPIVVWTRNPVGFIIETDNPAYPIRITRERIGDFDLGVDAGNLVDETTVVPLIGSIQTLFYITLGRGKNRLTAQELLPSGGGRKKVIEVIASTNTLIYESYGREIFKPTNKAQKQKDALYSKYSTRLLDQVAGVGDILPDLQTLKTLSTKMLIRSFVHFPATEIGLKDSIEAVTLNTPIFSLQKEKSNYQIETSRIMRTMENVSGVETHIWFPNLSVTRWLAFLRMADSFKNNFEIISVRDDYVRIKYKGQVHEHFFNYDAFGQNFLTNLSLNDCFNNFDISSTASMLLNIRICCWSYPFDEIITEESTLGSTRAYLDSGVPFDSDIPFDADPVDPWSDGFIGWSLSGRFDGNLALDSSVNPALGYAGDACVYKGPYVQLLNSYRADTEIFEIVTASGEMDTYVGGPVTGLAVDFDNTIMGLETNKRVFTAGESILLCLKYVDSNNMCNKTGSGLITATEPLSGATVSAPVAAGFIYAYITPTVATDSTMLNLNDGTYTGTSDSFKILPAAIDTLIISSISNQTAGIPFSITVQAVDIYGNIATNNLGSLVSIHALGSLTDPTPSSVYLVNGAATFNVTMSQAGTGTLKFSLGTITVESNSFTVS